jgi:hypothetical protein
MVTRVNASSHWNFLGARFKKFMKIIKKAGSSREESAFLSAATCSNKNIII